MPVDLRPEKADVPLQNRDPLGLLPWHHRPGVELPSRGWCEEQRCFYQLRRLSLRRRRRRCEIILRAGGLEVARANLVRGIGVGAGVSVSVDPCRRG